MKKYVLLGIISVFALGSNVEAIKLPTLDWQTCFKNAPDNPAQAYQDAMIGCLPTLLTVAGYAACMGTAVGICEDVCNNVCKSDKSDFRDCIHDCQKNWEKIL